MRVEREETRRVDTVKQAPSAPVKIEPPGGAGGGEERPRQARAADPAVPRRRGSIAAAVALLDDPKPQAKGYDEDTLETPSRQIEFKPGDFRIDAQVVGAYPGR